MIRYVHRPRAIRKTPKLLCSALGAERTVAWPPQSHRRRARWFEDFFMYYPPLDAVEDLRDPSLQNSRRDYEVARKFLVSCKQDQRGAIIAAGFPTPRTWNSFPLHLGESGGRFVVRPAHHRQGVGYRIITDPSPEAGLWNPNEEYLSEFYPKDFEYRILTVRGEPLITLLKQVPDGLSNELPWNHANGTSFVTVRDWGNNRLRHTDIYDRIRGSELVKSFDIIGIDVMYRRDGSYVIPEFNLCPAITIPENIERVAQYVDQTPRSERIL